MGRQGIDEALMRVAGMLAVIGLAGAICCTTEANAIQGGSVTVSGRLELSRELRPFPRPPVIVNAAPKPSENAVVSSQVEQKARAGCLAGRSQGTNPGCREGQKAPPERPAS